MQQAHDWRRRATNALSTLLATVVIASLLVAVIGPSQLRNGLALVSRVLPARAVSLAFFYRPPKDSSTLKTVAESNDVVTLVQSDTKYRDDLKAAGFGGQFLQYVLFM